MSALNFISENVNINDFEVFNSAANYLKINTCESFKTYLSKLDYKMLNLSKDFKQWSKEDISFFIYEVVNEEAHNTPVK